MATGLPDTAEDGHKWMAATYTLRNATRADLEVGSAITPILELEDGGEVESYAACMSMVWRDVPQTVKPTGEIQMRVAFMVPEAAKPRILRVHAAGLMQDLDGARKIHRLSYDHTTAPPAN